MTAYAMEFWGEQRQQRLLEEAATRRQLRSVTTPGDTGRTWRSRITGLFGRRPAQTASAA